MEFKLQFDIPPFKKQVRPDSKLFFAGSCFSENIARLFHNYKFRAESNTHGILYNPASIAISLGDCLNRDLYSEADLFFAEDRWNSFQHHSRFSSQDKQQCLDSINDNIEKGHKALKESDFIFITFGSAYTYKHLSSGITVGNCHKVPQKEFQKILLNKEKIIETYTAFIEKIKTINPSITIVFTVSPVRYIRDGVAENNLSKAVLLQAVHELTNTFIDTVYFPAYEIVNDELRDYRFFEEDFVHPNRLAIQYVWERLMETSFSAESKTYTADLELILKAAAHKAFNPDSDSHKKFKAAHLRKCEEFEKCYPHTDLSEEKKHFTV
ncbi:MAG: hypothetical protein K0S33_1830 [Bacteroidetes bacterium]|jgi:hypothetical protein|nr:hypothetical protein [Bacteroidota bacterium]